MTTETLEERLSLPEILKMATGVPEEVGGEYLADHNYIFLRAHSSETARMAYDNLKTNLVRELRLQEGEDYLELDLGSPLENYEWLPDKSYQPFVFNLNQKLTDRDNRGAGTGTPYIIFLKNSGTIPQGFNIGECWSRLNTMYCLRAELGKTNFMMVQSVGDEEYENGTEQSGSPFYTEFATLNLDTHTIDFDTKSPEEIAYLERRLDEVYTSISKRMNGQKEGEQLLFNIYGQSRQGKSTLAEKVMLRLIRDKIFEYNEGKWIDVRFLETPDELLQHGTDTKFYIVDEADNYCRSKQKLPPNVLAQLKNPVVVYITQKPLAEVPPENRFEIKYQPPE